MSWGYDATASLAPLNYTSSFLNPTQQVMGQQDQNSYNTAMANNPQALYGPGGFGAMTDYYSAQGAAYGRDTGGFGGTGAYATQQPMGSVFDTGAAPFQSYGAGGSPYGGGGFGGSNPADDPNSAGRLEQQRNDPGAYQSWLTQHNALAFGNTTNSGNAGLNYGGLPPEITQGYSSGSQGYPSGVVNGPYALQPASGYYSPFDDPNSSERLSQKMSDPEGYAAWLAVHNANQGGGGGGNSGGYGGGALPFQFYGQPGGYNAGTVSQGYNMGGGGMPADNPNTAGRQQQAQSDPNGYYQWLGQFQQLNPTAYNTFQQPSQPWQGQSPVTIPVPLTLSIGRPAIPVLSRKCFRRFSAWKAATTRGASRAATTAYRS